MARENAMPPRRYNLRPLPSRKKMNICLTYLPPEIIFNILLCLPAEVLYNVMKLVCRDWYNIIHSSIFIDTHLIRSSRGIIFSQVWPRRFVHYLEMEKHAVKVTELYPSSSTCPGNVVTSCNGLILFTKQGNCNMFIGNPVTKEIIALPRINATTRSCFNSGLAYASCSKKYKVAHFYAHGRKGHCNILTVNIDKEWRLLGGMQEALMPKKIESSSLVYNPPISTEGFVHLTRNDLPYTLSLDVETEKFYVSTIPKSLQRKFREYSVMDGFLCFMNLTDSLLREFWVLKDVEAGEWTKMDCVDLDCQYPWLQGSLYRGFQLLHVGCLNDGEYMIFHVKRYTYPYAVQSEANPANYICYNANTGTINLFQLDDDASHRAHMGTYFPNVKSLVSLKGN